MSNPYNQGFYDEQVEGSRRSAEHVLRYLFAVYQPRSVIDVGCGRGTWLTVAGMLGATELHGFDGDWVRPGDLVSDRIVFKTSNLNEHLPLNRRYDLCICVEVAEHLDNGRADGLVDDLCTASDVVLFGAAVPGQGGAHHVNERWASYWIERFLTRNYGCYDIFRGWAWNKSEVEWWYRQNSFLFVSEKAADSIVSTSLLRAMVQPAYDSVHPELYMRKVEALAVHEKQMHSPSLRTIARAATRYIRDRAALLWSASPQKLDP